MDEIKITARLDTCQEWGVLLGKDLVPAHMRNPGVWRIGLEADHIPFDPAKALMFAKFIPPFRKQLHAKADAEKGYAPIQNTFRHNLIKPPLSDIVHPIAKRTDAWQDDAVGITDLCREACDHRGATALLDSPEYGIDITHAIVDDGYPFHFRFTRRRLSGR